MSEGTYSPVLQGLDDAPAAPVAEAPAPAPAEQNPANSEAQPSADAEQTPTDGDSGGDEKPQGGKGVARKIDRLTREAEHWKRVAAELQARQQGGVQPEPTQQAAPAPADAEPTREQFSDYESYQRAVAEHTARKVVSDALSKHTEAITRQQREAQARESAARTARELEQRISTGAKDIPDWQEVLESDAPLAPHLIPLLAESDVPARVLHYLHKNPSVAEQISAMPGPRAALKLGEISAQLKAAPQPSNAPPPGQPVGGKAASPKSLADMDMDEYVAARKKGRQR